MGGKSSSLSLTLNSISTSFDLESLWSFGNYATVSKNDPIMLRKEENRAVSISENTTVLKDGYYK